MMEPTVRPRRSLFERRTFNIESTLNSIGVHNEYFLHHRRRGSCYFCCRFLWPAPLNMECKIRLAGERPNAGTAAIAALSRFQTAASEYGTLTVISAELKVTNAPELKPASPKQMCRAFCQSL
jgi:hypothetical protein